MVLPDPLSPPPRIRIRSCLEHGALEHFRLAAALRYFSAAGPATIRGYRPDRRSPVRHMSWRIQRECLVVRMTLDDGKRKARPGLAIPQMVHPQPTRTSIPPVAWPAIRHPGHQNSAWIRLVRCDHEIKSCNRAGNVVQLLLSCWVLARLLMSQASTVFEAHGALNRGLLLSCPPGVLSESEGWGQGRVVQVTRAKERATRTPDLCHWSCNVATRLPANMLQYVELAFCRK